MRAAAMFVVQTSVIDVELIQYGGVPVVIGAITSHVLTLGAQRAVLKKFTTARR